MTQALSEDLLSKPVTGNTCSRADIVRVFGSGEIMVTKAANGRRPLTHRNSELLH